MSVNKKKITARDLKFTNRSVTKIWEEIPQQNNPYLVEQNRCHGYDLSELINKRSFVDVLFLLYIGELPNKDQAQLLETIMIALINPGPRHPATRAAMNCGVGKTNPAHILPISLSVLSGEHLGGEEVIHSMRFIRKHLSKDPQDVASNLLEKHNRPPEGDWHITHGFGSRFGAVDPIPQKIAEIILRLPGSGKPMHWCAEFVDALKPMNLGWLSTGLAAAAFCNLGFPYRAGAGLFQLFNAPGLLAHGIELSNKPITAMPFLDNEHYIIADAAKKN